MILVSNTGPIIILAKVDHLWVLQRAANQVWITPEIEIELKAKRGAETPRIHQALKEFLRVRKTNANPVEWRGPSGVDLGERSAICLAMEMEAEIVLLDDQAGRKAAEHAGLNVMGTAGFLVTAKNAGVIPAVLPVLELMRLQDYWISDAVFANAAKLAGEVI